MRVLDPYLTTEQVAQILYVDVRTIRRHMKITKEIGIKVPWVKFGRKVLWKKQSIEKWVEELEKNNGSKLKSIPSGEN
tara:strand:- start:259 stop:492 length:234 start_codon:yes stop_codon:yes gene_type:complete